ncbi:MAG: LytTR family transcriptional regulator [Clostridia bacterium]|nr:LytTR family transcriptional regulator [Clostridia bacterium]
MKLRIEIDPEGPEEIVIRSREISDRLRRIQETIDRELNGSEEIAVRNGDDECYLPYRELLFFETVDNRVYAHTAKDTYVCPLRLNDLTLLLPRYFARASKSCIVNTSRIRSISRGPTGVSTASFANCDKKAFISRMYYKIVREIIEETRLK